MPAPQKPSLNLSEREVFLNFCRHGNLTKAAESLNIYPSTVSRCINNLEKNLSVKLVKKAGNKLSLTECGKNYYNILNSLLEEILSYEKEISQDDSLDITLITSDFFLDAWVSKCISEFIDKRDRNKIRLISNGYLSKDNIKENTIFVGSGRHNNDAQQMLLKNISKAKLGFYARKNNSFVTEDRMYSIQELTKFPIIKISSEDNNYLTSLNGKISYEFTNTFMIVDSIYLCAYQGIHFDCIFVACESSTAALIQEGEIYKIKTNEELDPIYIDVLFTKNLKNKPLALDLINSIYTAGVALFHPQTPQLSSPD
ncbi:LysR family transcriptional regulator [Acetobacter farinalis]|uniref:LysR family transcriptional regulator n=1 Tax=Acetobacter farinalis TaxID=1260984 RepID=A0ABT3QAF8_9PROT|nr:LysR family transcriptional regulator [Acetobacter farinalis]MCX2562283.1 LysR family transcriptional regulator [Acetobacter farinalis]